MNTSNIEEMVRTIAGSFPTDDVYKPDVVKAWERHDLIRNMTVEEARAVQKFVVNTCTGFPSIHDIVKSHRALFGRKVHECRTCDNTGWVIPYDEHGNRLTQPHQVSKALVLDYTYVVQCWHCNGGVNPNE